MIPIAFSNTENGAKLLKSLLSRNIQRDEKASKVVEKIIGDVSKFGDKALFSYTKEFDAYELTAQNIKVTQEEINKAIAELKADSGLYGTIKKSAERIKTFHQKQKINSWLETSENGEILGQMLRPLETVGVYVPGGKASYPSSVIMNIIPAKVAGVKNIIAATPANAYGVVNSATIAAASIAGADSIYKIGGAQAVAAMAFGTESVPKVDKIVGPGNIYVAMAKRAVYGYVGIDSVAGPSEILIIADERANPVFTAADMLSQAEHDELASAILVTNSEKLAARVQKEIYEQQKRLDRANIIKESLEYNSAIIVTDTIKEALSISNIIAPEHLELCVAEPFALLPLIKNAGAIFLGDYSPEPLGDYIAGPNHVLPTNGTARFFSPLSVDDFVKKSSVISFGREALSELSDDIIRFANAEGLTAHANAIKVRFTGGGR